MNDNSTEAQQIVIDKLAKLLSEGNFELNKVIGLINKGDDLSKLNISPRHSIDKWAKEVSSFLANTFGSNHYLVFRSNRKDISRKFENLKTATLEEYAVSIEARLEVLEDTFDKLDLKKTVVESKQLLSLQKEKLVKYELTYSYNRELKLNGIKFAKPDFETVYDKFATFLFKEGNSFRSIKIAEWHEYLGSGADEREKKLSIHKLLGGLKITGDMKQVFMPNASVKAFMFQNPISFKFATDNALPELNIDSEVVGNSPK